MQDGVLLFEDEKLPPLAQGRARGTGEADGEGGVVMAGGLPGGLGGGAGMAIPEHLLDDW